MFNYIGKKMLNVNIYGTGYSFIERGTNRRKIHLVKDARSNSNFLEQRKISCNRQFSDIIRLALKRHRHCSFCHNGW